MMSLLKHFLIILSHSIGFKKIYKQNYIFQKNIKNCILGYVYHIQWFHSE